MHARIVELASSAPNAAAFEEGALAVLASEIGYDIAFVAGRGDAPTTDGVDRAFLGTALATARYEEEIVPLKRAALARAGVVVDTDVLGERAVRRTRYYREIGEPVGGRSALVAFLRLRDQVFATLVLGRAGRARFTDADVARVEAVLPALAVARASFLASLGTMPVPLAPRRSLARVAVDALTGTRELARNKTAEGEIVVRDRDGHREMVARPKGGGELVWTRVKQDDAARSGFFYVDLLALAAALSEQRRRALVVGCGGAAVVRKLVEVHPDLRVDAYDGCELPHGFDGDAFFATARRVLSQRGVVAMNVIGALGGASDVQAVERAARTAFADVRLVPVLDPGEGYSPAASRNVVVLARR